MPADPVQNLSAEQADPNGMAKHGTERKQEQCVADQAVVKVTLTVDAEAIVRVEIQGRNFVLKSVQYASLLIMDTVQNFQSCSSQKAGLH